jgi:hypothetical protein
MKVALGVIAAYFIAGSPFARALVIMTGIMLLMDDFYAYMDGRKSVKTLSPIWHEFLNIGEDLRKTFNDIIAIFNGNYEVTGFKKAILEIAEAALIGFKALIGIADILALKIHGRQSDVDKLHDKIRDQLSWDIQHLGTSEFGNYPGAVPAPKPAAPGLGGIGAVESGGNYGAVNPDTGAFGKYQILPSNWSGWAKEAGLPRGAQPTPANQEYVANFKWDQYMKKFGSAQLAAAAWYAGEGYARTVQEGHPMYSPYVHQGKYLSVDDYVLKATGQHLEIGEVNIHVGGTNATPQEIHIAVRDGIQEAMGQAASRDMRQAGGPYN